MRIRDFIEARSVRAYSQFETLQKIVRILDAFIIFLGVLLIVVLLMGAYFITKQTNHAIIQTNKTEIQIERY